MSRTRRHRPYWVQAGEHGTGEFHQHKLLGQPKTRFAKKRDEHGRVLLVTQPVAIQLREAAVLPWSIFDKPEKKNRIRGIRAEALRRLEAGESPYAKIDGVATAAQPVYEERLLGHYADYCTLDTTQDRDGRVAGRTDLYAPCSRDLEGKDRWVAFGRSRGERRWSYNRDWRQPSRRAVRNAARALAKDADTWVETDLDEAGVFTR